MSMDFRLIAWLMSGKINSFDPDVWMFRMWKWSVQFNLLKMHCDLSLKMLNLDRQNHGGQFLPTMIQDNILTLTVGNWNRQCLDFVLTRILTSFTKNSWHSWTFIKIRKFCCERRTGVKCECAVWISWFGSLPFFMSRFVNHY